MARSVNLTQGQVALVDGEDYDAVIAAGPWRALWSRRVRGGVYYARRSVPSPSTNRRKTQCLHNFITGYAQTDHINHNTLDNRRANLREATNRENAWNQQKQRTAASSQYKGVVWHKRDSRWQAGIKVDGKQLHLGLFKIEAAAARAYDEAACFYFGRFVSCNLPDAPYLEGCEF